METGRRKGVSKHIEPGPGHGDFFALTMNNICCKD